eukprot:TRINITY_DN11498_c0_g1_i3.p1 TRINITY_DN11498_c0_g1~~TRINITY_DN11498_c0_g1_i3.p1  ORF type:complete len:180 (-),score=31.83 TRINITY_DN11498_c0_g1_i3:829-1368(-)
MASRDSECSGVDDCRNLLDTAAKQLGFQLRLLRQSRASAQLIDNAIKTIRTIDKARLSLAQDMSTQEQSSSVQVAPEMQADDHNLSVHTPAASSQPNTEATPSKPRKYLRARRSRASPCQPAEPAEGHATPWIADVTLLPDTMNDVDYFMAVNPPGVKVYTFLRSTAASTGQSACRRMP